MHPVLARYLDPETARAVLRRAEAHEPSLPEDADLLEAAGSHPAERKAVLQAGKRLDSKAQQAVLFLATHAALRALRKDESLRPELEKAWAALSGLGAEKDEVDAVLAQLVADEAFGTDQDPGEFDRAWFLETLRGLPGLMALDEAEVLALLEEFASRGGTKDRAFREQVARALVESAWSDGPSPISAENVEDALDELQEALGEKQFGRAALVLAEFLEALGGRGLLGPLRRERLVTTARRAASSGRAGQA